MCSSKCSWNSNRNKILKPMVNMLTDVQFLSTFNLNLLSSFDVSFLIFLDFVYVFAFPMIITYNLVLFERAFDNLCYKEK